MNCFFIESQSMEEEAGKSNPGGKQSWASVVESVQKTLQERELTCQILEQKIEELEADLEREGLTETWNGQVGLKIWEIASFTARYGWGK